MVALGRDACRRDRTVIIAIFLLASLAGAQQPAPRRKFRDNPAGRQAWFARGRQAPPGQPAAWYLQRARRQLERMPVLRPRSSPPAAALAHGAVRLLGTPPPEFGGQWTALGPAPETTSYWGDVAGRVTALALDPADSSGNTLYMAAAYGGLWKSTNAMSASPVFAPIGDNLPTLAVGSIAIDDSTSPPTIYVGSGEPNNSGDSYYGDGIFKSTDGGQTWTQSSQADGGAETFLGLAFGTILIAPGNSQTLLACAASANDVVPGVNTEVPGVYESTDGGATWTLALSSPTSLPYGFVASGESCTALLYAPAFKEYVAALSGSGFFVSPTGANGTWKLLPSPFPSGTAASPYNFFRASLAVRGGVWYSLIADGDSTLSAAGTGDTGLALSANAGQTWQAVAAPPELFCAAQGSIPCQGAYDQYIAAPPNGSGLVAAGIDVWSTASLGGTKTTWTNLTRSYTNGVVHPDQHAIAFVDGQHWFIGNDGGVWSTADAGTDWTDMNATLNTIQFMSVSAAGGGVYIGGSQDNGTALSAASGTNWNLIWGGDGGDTAVSPTNAQELLTENYDVSLQHSEDGGQTFNPVVTSTTISGPSDFYVPYELDPSNPSQVLLGASGVWQGPADPTAAGVGWAQVGALSASSPCQLVPNDVITALAAAPSSAGVIYAGFADGQLYVTNNAAAASPTWASINSPVSGRCDPPLPIGALAVSPADPNAVYVGVQGLGVENIGVGHVYKSTDGGQTFTDITGNLPDVPVNSIIVDPAEPSNIYVADDLGVFAASDGGSSGEQWERLGTGLPATAVLQIALTSGANPSIVAATHGRGAWVIPAAAPPNFTLSITPATQTLTNTNTATFTIQTTTVNGYSGNLTLSCTSPVSGCSFSPATIAVGGSATLTVDATQLTVGNTTVTVQASDGAITHTATATVTVNNFALYIVQTNPVQLQAGAPAETVDLSVGGSAAYSGTITFSCPDAPTGVQCAFSPSTVTFAAGGMESSSLLTSLTAGASTAVGNDSVTVSATDGTVTHTLSVPFSVAGFSLSMPSETYVLAGTATTSVPLTVATLSGDTAPVALSCQTESPVTCSVSPASAPAGTPVTLTLGGLANLTGGSGWYQFSVTGASGGVSRTAYAAVNINDFSLTEQFNGTQAVLPGVASLSLPLFAWSWGQFAAPVSLSCTGLAAPASCAFSPNPVTPDGAFTITVSGLSGLPTGTLVNFTAAGSGGGLQRSVPVTLAISDFTIVADSFGGVSYRGQPTPAQVNVNLDPAVAPASFPGVSFQLTQCSAPAPLACTIASGSGQADQISIAGLNNWTGPDQPAIALTAAATQDGVTLTHTVDWPMPIADFSLAARTASASVKPGGIAAYQLTAAAVNDWFGQVQLTCSGLPAGASCTLAPEPDVQTGDTLLIASSANPFTLDIQTAAASSSLAPPPAGGGTPWLLILAAFAAAAAVALWPGRRNRLRWIPAGLSVLFLAAFLAGCGGGPSSVGGAGGGGGSNLPPATTYQVTVTATEVGQPQGWKAVSHSLQLSLTVQ